MCVCLTVKKKKKKKSKTHRTFSGSDCPAGSAGFSEARALMQREGIRENGPGPSEKD